MTKILSVASAFPKYKYSQQQMTEFFLQLFPSELSGSLNKFHESVQVGSRYFSLPLESYKNLSGLGERSRAWAEISFDLSKKCIKKLFDDSQININSIGHIFFTSVTGMSAPSIDAQLVNYFSLSNKIKRTPIFGLGCLGGAALVSRAHDYLRAYPEQAALIVGAELCSLTLQQDDHTRANLIATGLFGDGCAAALLVGDKHPLSQKNKLVSIINTHASFFPNTHNIMGWDIRDTGFKIILSPEVPDIARNNLCPEVKKFLHMHNLTAPEINYWVGHPGGPKVVLALEQGLELASDALKYSRQSLREIGNISSVSVLCVLEKILQSQPQVGKTGLMFAMGPAFCAELVLLKW